MRTSENPIVQAEAREPWCTPAPDNLELRLAAAETSLDALQKRFAVVDSSVAAQAAAHETHKVSLVVYSNSLDSLIAAMTMATGAAAMGSEVSLFFTFWATAALRNGRRSGGRPFLDRMFGWMLPSGTRQLKLSRLNMGGLGTSLMKKQMKAKDFPDLEELFELAEEMEVQLLVCEASLSLLGMEMEDLVDYPGIAACGVSSFLSAASDSDVTLFI